VAWRFGRGGEAPLPDLGDAGHWLTRPERERAAAFQVQKRRDDWLVGRLNLKALLVTLVDARCGQPCLPSHIDIVRLPSGAPSVRLSADAPRVGPFVPGSPLPLSVTNSHSHGAALAAAVWVDGMHDRVAVGADLEWIEPRSEGFIRDFLTRQEQDYCAEPGRARDVRANLVWSAKEAVRKVLQIGLSADTWWLTCLPDDAAARAPAVVPALDGPPADVSGSRIDVALEPEPGTWRSFEVTCDPRLGAQGISFAGRWRVLDGFAATVAVGARAVQTASPEPPSGVGPQSP
jgi:phosphopantetheinyl transferase